MRNANLLLCLLMQLLFIFFLNDFFRLPMRYQKAYIVHLGMSSLHSPQVGRGCFAEGMAESGKSKDGHVATGVVEFQKKKRMTVGEQSW